MRRVGVIALLLSLSTLAATADDLGFGLRGGLTTDPDTFFVGGHLQFSGLIPDTDALVFEPSVELGFGDETIGNGPGAVDYTTLRAAADLKWMLHPGSDSTLHFYPLVGLSIYNLSLSDCDGDCSSTELGLNLGGGVSFGAIAVEVALGTGDTPELSARVSYTFGK